MIISHKYKFVFFRSHKTGSTSLQLALSDIAGPEDVVCPLEDEYLRSLVSNVEPQNYLLKHHETSRVAERILGLLNLTIKKRHHYWPRHGKPDEIRRKLGSLTYDTYFKFVVIRSPFETVLSDYFWLQRNKSTGEAPAFTPSHFEAFLQSTQWRNRLSRNERLYTSCKDHQNFSFFRYEELSSKLYEFANNLELPNDWIAKFHSLSAKGGLRPKSVTSNIAFGKNTHLSSLVTELFPNICEDFKYLP